MRSTQKSRRLLAQQLGRACARLPWPADADRADAGQVAPRGNWRRLALPVGSSNDVGAERGARDSRTARLEAVLFTAREPLTTRRLAQFARLADGTEARTLVRRLNRWYDECGSAFRAEEVAGGFQLMSRPQFGVWLRRLYGAGGELRLSAPALETLAVVAYRQPVLRVDVEAIRGVDCGEMLRQLMDRDLVRTAGRAEELGRPYRYATTRRFLQVFGLKHLDDLPRADVLRTAAAASIPAADSMTVHPSQSDGAQAIVTTTASEDEEESERDYNRQA